MLINFSNTHLSPLQTNKFSMTNFYVASSICSSVRATFPIFSMTSALVEKASMLAFQQVLLLKKNGLNLSKTCHKKLLCIHTYTHR